MDKKDLQLLELGVLTAGEEGGPFEGYWLVKGKLRNYFVKKDNNNVYDEYLQYISVVQPPYGHTLHDTLAVVMALKNDDVMSEYIPTLKNDNRKHIIRSN